MCRIPFKLILLCLISIGHSLWVSTNSSPNKPYISYEFSPHLSVSAPQYKGGLIGEALKSLRSPLKSLQLKNIFSADGAMGLQSRFMPKRLPKFIQKPLFPFAKKRSQNAEKKFEQVCDRLHGSVLEGECYEYIPMELNFNQAQEHCMKKEMGHIWTPNFDDIHLFDKIRLTLPAFTAAPKNAIWIGARINNRMIVDVNGMTVTDKQFFRIENDDPSMIDGCAIYNFQTGAQTFSIDLCDDEPYHFICEYNVTRIIMDEEEQKPSLIFQKGPFVFFEKFYTS